MKDAPTAHLVGLMTSEYRGYYGDLSASTSSAPRVSDNHAIMLNSGVKGEQFMTWPKI